jgi:hypothetical protein
MLCNAALMVRLSNFYSRFKPNFLFDFQVVRESNRSTFEGPLYLQRVNLGTEEMCDWIVLTFHIPDMQYIIIIVLYFEGNVKFT